MKDGKLTEIRAKLQQLQDVLAESLDICLVLIDRKAAEITIPSGYPLYCFQSEKKGCGCHEELLAMTTASRTAIMDYKCPHNLHVALLPTATAAGSRQLYLIAGKTDNSHKLKTGIKILRAVYDLPLAWPRHSGWGKQPARLKSPAERLPLLTQQERIILSLITSGCSNKTIAEKLCISLSTVKSHVAHILQKLNLNNRTEAGIYALENNLVLLGADFYESQR